MWHPGSLYSRLKNTGSHPASMRADRRMQSLNSQTYERAPHPNSIKIVAPVPFKTGLICYRRLDRKVFHVVQEWERNFVVSKLPEGFHQGIVYRHEVIGTMNVDAESIITDSRQVDSYREGMIVRFPFF